MTAQDCCRNCGHPLSEHYDHLSTWGYCGDPDCVCVDPERPDDATDRILDGLRDPTWRSGREGEE